MKKIISFLLVVTLMIANNINVYANNTTEELIALTENYGYDINPNNAPKTSIVIDAHSGQILWAQNPDLKADPASTSKLFTLYLVYEAIARGELTLQTEIIATNSDEAISKIHALSNNNIVAGVAYPVEELIKLALVPSSNVATVMLANHLSSGDTDKFVDEINITAKKLGMTNTKFTNATGAVAVAFDGYYSLSKYDNSATNITTVRDLSILTYNFLKKYPEVLNYTKDNKITTMIGTPYEETFKSYNHSLSGQIYELEGVDGLKTGSSPTAGFNIVATAIQNDLRLIVIEMGVGDWSDQQGEKYRHPFINSLFLKSFDDYEKRVVLKKGSHTINNINIQLDEDFVAVVKKGEEPKFKIENNRLILLTTNETINETHDSISVSIETSKISKLISKAELYKIKDILGIKSTQNFIYIVVGTLITILLILILVIRKIFK